jgi:transposase
LQELRKLVSIYGSSKLVYIDESGFELETFRPLARSPRGQKVHGERNACKRPRTSLIAAKCGTKLLAPILFQGSTNSVLFNHWLEHHLLQELKTNSILILDNARFHNKNDIQRIAEMAGHIVLFLPPYSEGLSPEFSSGACKPRPDFNPIEQDFATIKKRRIYASPGTTLDSIIQSYGN